MEGGMCYTVWKGSGNCPRGEMSGEYISGRKGELCPEKCPDPLVYTGLSFTDSTATSHFYRAVQCIARTVLSKDICLSVRLSVFLTVTRRYCVETAKQHHQTFFTAGYPHHSSFSAQNVMAIIQREPPNGGFECTGTKNRNFGPIFRFISKWYKIEP